MTQSLEGWLKEEIAIAEAAGEADPVYKYWYEAGTADFNAGIDPTMIETRYAERLSMPDSQPETRRTNQIYRDGMSHASIKQWIERVNQVAGGNNGQPG